MIGDLFYEYTVDASMENVYSEIHILGVISYRIVKNSCGILDLA